MALAHRAAPRLGVRDLIAEGGDFAREAWREAWLVMLLLVGVQTYLFARGHIAVADWRRSPIDWLVPLLLVFYIPLYGALYRAALGGRPAAGLGVGGLQWRGVEWRLIAVGFVIVFLAGLAMAPFVAASLIAALVMGLHASMSIGPFGGWARWTPATVVIWLLFFWLMAPRIARLMLGWAYSTAAEKIEPFAGWGSSRRSGWPLAFALVAACAPLALGWLALYALTLVEPDTLSGEYWPVPEAVGAGVLLAVLKVAVVAPLGVGVLTGAWWLLEGEGADAPAAVAPIRPEPHRFLDSLGPATLAAMTAAGAALAVREAAELGLHPTQIDRDAEPPPEPQPGPGHDPAAEGAHTPDATPQPVGAPAAAPAETWVVHNADSPKASPEPAGSASAEDPPTPGGPAPLDLTGAVASDRDLHIVHPAEAAEPEAPQPILAEPAPPEAFHIFNPRAPTAPGRIAALSAWPHSILPLWPTAVKAEAAAAAPSALASGAEPDHPSTEVSERH